MEVIINYLNLFNRKLSKLLNLSFSQKLDRLNIVYRKDGYSLHIFKDGVQQTIDSPVFIKEMSSEEGLLINGPTGEEFDSYILSIRFFIQNNDMLSIGNWIKKIANAEIHDPLKERAHKLRYELNKILDSPRMNVKLKAERRVLTARDIIETYVYGEYAHSNPDKNSLYNEVFSGNGNLSFILCTKELSEVLKGIREFNDEVILHLQS